MAEQGGGRREDDDWIFAQADPGTLPTEQLPGEADVQALLARHEAERQTGWTSGRGTRAESSPLAARAAAPAAVRAESYARSGTTPEAEGAPPARVVTLPSRFAGLSWWDAVRDLAALAALSSALTVPYTSADIGAWRIAPHIAIALALLGVIGAHLLRWIPEAPPLRAVRLLRVVGTAPAILVALATLVADAALSLPRLFAPLPDGPPVGIAVGVALLLLGGLLGIEPRRHEGYVPGEAARARTRHLLLAIGGTALVLLAIALVMTIGRLFTTGWAFSLRSLADTGLSTLLLVLVLAAGLRRERSRYVFAVAVVAGLVLGALADNTLRLQFAQPRSVATGLVYLPLLFAAFAVMVSRSFVRTMPLSFRRVDWIVYAVRALELSTIVHVGAVVWSVLAAIASTGGVGWGGPVLHLVDAVLSAIFAVMSSFGRRALLERPAASARATAVVSSVVMVVLGFLDVIVNSVASGTGAGLVTGGVALTIGIAVALMLTVPAPVRDRYGAPDVVAMFEDFRRRDADGRSVLARVPDVSAERSVRRSFPGA